MKFSLIIPVYNSEVTLDACVESILATGFTDYELILVNDGSGDRSGEICHAYAAAHPQISVIDQTNAGPAAARNRGIEAAKGDYLLFADSDDSVESDYFSVLEKELADDCDFLVFGLKDLFGEKEMNQSYPAAEFKNPKDASGFFYQFTEYSLNSACTKAFPRKMILENDIRFPEGTVVEEDLLFVLRALKASRKIRVIENPLYCYHRRSSGSVTTSYNPIKFDSKVPAYREEISFSREWNNSEMENFYHNKFLTFLSVSINNLMFDSCPLSRREKIAEIRRFYTSDAARDCLAAVKPIWSRSRMMFFLVRHRLYRTSYLIHKIVFKTKGRH